VQDRSLQWPLAEYDSSLSSSLSGECKLPTSGGLCPSDPLGLGKTRKRRRKRKPPFLIVGEDHFLSYTRAQIFRNWEAVIRDSTDAPLSINADAYDLVILCHPVPDSVAQEMMACARKQYPDVKFWAIDGGWEPRLGLSTFTVEISNPGDRWMQRLVHLNSNGSGVR
jgi:hypothetical protein